MPEARAREEKVCFMIECDRPFRAKLIKIHNCMYKAKVKVTSKGRPLGARSDLCSIEI